jgi:serine/threonine protein phosphatase PrpC
VSNRPLVSSAAATHPGLRRADNEDAFCARPDLGLYLVADGMGGHAAGEVASQLAVEAIERFVAESQNLDPGRWPIPLDPLLSLEANRLKVAMQLANQRIGAAMAADDALRGMATTAAALLLSEGAPVIAHVGDSRVYLWRDGRLRQLTEDHSWVGEQVRAGALTDADARRHPWRNVVTRAIAGGADLEVDVGVVELATGDRVLVCSDGLSAVVAHERLEAILAGRQSLQETCDTLVAAANEAGGPDNITVLTLQVDVA